MSWAVAVSRGVQNFVSCSPSGGLPPSRCLDLPLQYSDAADTRPTRVADQTVTNETMTR
jgi:hypothetical protein